MRILVVGAGAVGGYFGGRLAEAGRDVTFLVRARRAEEIKSRGLQILSSHGDLTLHPAVINAQQIAGPYDLIFLSVKSFALAGAMDDFSAAVGPRTMILPVLNGMQHIDILTSRFGKVCVLGGVCLVATEIDEAGRVQQLADFQSLLYGEIDGPSTPRLRLADESLQGGGFDASISEHIVRDMWQKWVQLATLGAINCLLRGSIGQIAAIPGSAGVCLSILHECVRVAEASGYPQTSAFLERQKADLTSQGSIMTSSMYRDLKRGLPIEADTILGDLFRRGQQQGLKTPLLEAAFANVTVYQRQRETQ